MARLRELEIDEDIGFQRKTWVAQRAGWVLLTLFILTACWGLTGPSGLTSVVHETEAFRLEFPRFGRQDADLFLKVMLKGGRHSFSLSNDYIEKVYVQNVLPMPRAQAGGQTRTRFDFDPATDGTVTTVVVKLRPMRGGTLLGGFEVDGARENLKHYIYF